MAPNPALPKDQPLRGSWRDTTNTYMDRYKPAAIPNPHIIGLFGMEHHAFDTKQRYKEKPLCQLPRCDYLSTCHFFTHPISFKVYCVHHINNLIQYALGNNKYSLRQLPRSDCLSSSYFFTHPILFKVYCRHRINNLYNTRWGTINTCYLNYRVTVA